MKRYLIIISILLFGLSFPINSFGECIKGNCVNGYGVSTQPDGTKYQGEWKDDKRHGKGVYTYSNGTKHEGEWKDGEFYK